MTIKESCDPLLVQILLQAAERRNINLVNKGDYPGDTALHYVALRNEVALHQQAKVVQLLVRYGAMSNRCGSQGRTPLALVSAERKSVRFSHVCIISIIPLCTFEGPMLTSV